MRAVIALLMFAGIVAFLLFWTLIWFGLPTQYLAVGSLGIVFTATGLLFLGQALAPGWERDGSEPTPGRRAKGEMGRLTALGVGIWFSTCGVVWLGGGFLGERWMSGRGVWAFLGALAFGLVLILLGGRYDRRRAEEAQRDGARPAEPPAAADPSGRSRSTLLGSGRQLGRTIRRT